jgi:exodeoxyribonuclease VII large subunit
MELPVSEPAERRVYTITQITREIKLILETSFPTIWVEGEISNFKRHSSGHMYFVLKDENAQIPAVMWRNHNLRLFFTPQDGMKVLAQGNISVYEKRGYYQFEVIQMQPAGIGELQLAFEQLKQRLRAEGLFEEKHKKPIPPFPERIGIVTSPTGAAIRDLVSVINRRFPGVQLILRPVRVQGEGAAEEIAQAIREFNEYGEVDLLIVGRGGGSLEDLWPFNEEIVARAIFESEIPIISAVGHEIDFSISDFVADLRAPTPSAAAELAVRNREELADYIQNRMQKIFRLLRDRLTYYREKVQHLEASYALRRPSDVIKQYRQRVDELHHNLRVRYAHLLQSRQQVVEGLQKQLAALSPASILQRGYTLCFSEDGKLVKTAESIQPQDRIHVQFYRGRLQSRVEKIDPDQSFRPDRLLKSAGESAGENLPSSKDPAA